MGSNSRALILLNKEDTMSESGDRQSTAGMIHTLWTREGGSRVGDTDCERI